jgi:hypothetical protein
MSTNLNEFTNRPCISFSLKFSSNFQLERIASPSPFVTHNPCLLPTSLGQCQFKCPHHHLHVFTLALIRSPTLHIILISQHLLSECITSTTPTPPKILIPPRKHYNNKLPNTQNINLTSLHNTRTLTNILNKQHKCNININHKYRSETDIRHGERKCGNTAVRNVMRKNEIYDGGCGRIVSVYCRT